MAEEIDKGVADRAFEALGIEPPALNLSVEMTDRQGNVVASMGRNFQKDALIDERLIDEMLITQPSIYGYYSLLLGTAKSMEQMYDNELRKVLAKTTIAVKNWLSGEGAKPTNPIIEAYVEIDEAVIKARQDLVIAKGWVDQIKTAVDTLYHKRESVSQLANNRRKEMEMDMQRRVMRSGVE